eukprot:CAMPEP_0181180152 /NCGR_PEP_ID=MMETSP1096-20121128/6643_1 /TAXON_ID=156174 ORGANISM="Chrysochromulina ericina, Strain CCMP281" /NCGR_SAMPLE_ID=MMETSP1096 /ASSEMBLY_ACC=CAM_ASM_000453 /LENGTH=64 /DNA_ID=CAMNT_0023268553 /DNA_START=210 /DNA_END=404 /DNA_ORIENTATION=+
MPSGDMRTCASLKIARAPFPIATHCGRLSRHLNRTSAMPAPDGTSAGHQVHAPPRGSPVMCRDK